ncbi:uncharacterized protein LOC132061374 [Lycium ferocissimum]|uniref:uncharacterized protein LOC132061374 n=1 Tax=Lycium ferocissimum TaxID=112874 RepID=UPI0028157412|nr:uncharacterized protein LOC132061374 [Lycium ferocissimum]
MSSLFWNIRGINKRYKQKELKKYLGNKRIRLAGLIETRVKDHNKARVLNNIVPGWKALNNYQQADNGRNLFVWDPSWLFGNPVSLQEVQDFYNACMQHIDVYEHPWQADYYIWSNKQQGPERITSRTNRSFGNSEWMLKWGQVVTLYDLPFISDHAPMLITLQQQFSHRHASFNFFNVWVDHDSFLPLVKDKWKEERAKNHMQNVWMKLKSLQPASKVLNNQEFKFIRLKIDKTREELLHLQEEIAHHPTDTLIQQEKQALLNLEKWSLIEESAFKQKSRVKWVKLGDSNNKYFFDVCKERSHRSQILEITSLAGIKLYDPQKIKEEFILFYGDRWVPRQFVYCRCANKL